MNETQSKVVKTEFGSAIGSIEAADAAFAYATQVEAIISELQTTTRQTYGQYCGLARAIEIIGERWALLVVRDLLVGPKRFTELLRGLPRVPADVLSSRLKELENAGVIRCRTVARDDNTYVYELTEYGNELEGIVLALGRWGVASLGEPQVSDVVTVDSVIMAIRTAFRPDDAIGRSLTCELRFGDLEDLVVNVRVDDGNLAVGAGPLPGADLVIEPGRKLKALLTGEVSAAEVLSDGSVSVIGDPELLSCFVELFQIAGSSRR